MTGETAEDGSAVSQSRATTPRGTGDPALTARPTGATVAPRIPRAVASVDGGAAAAVAGTTDRVGRCAAPPAAHTSRSPRRPARTRRSRPATGSPGRASLRRAASRRVTTVGWAPGWPPPTRRPWGRRKSSFPSARFGVAAGGSPSRGRRPARPALMWSPTPADQPRRPDTAICCSFARWRGPARTQCGLSTRLARSSPYATTSRRAFSSNSASPPAPVAMPARPTARSALSDVRSGQFLLSRRSPAGSCRPCPYPQAGRMPTAPAPPGRSGR